MAERIRQEKGQAIVLVALALVALVALLGLAIDGGGLYLDRRRMQNAADGAALAGARRLAQAICATNPSPTATDAEIYAVVQEFVRRNGGQVFEAHYVGFSGNQVVEYNPPVLVGGGTVPQYASGVVVTTTMTRPTYLLGIVGQNSGTVKASATAVAGPPLLVSGGLRPFGVPAQVVEQLNPGDWLRVDFDNNGGTIRWVSGVAQHRGWMNLGYVWNQRENPTWPRAVDEGTGANNLKYWMENGWNGTLYADCSWSAGCRVGDYIHAKPGTNASAVCAAPLNTVFYVPVYDEVPYCQTQIPAPKPDCPTQGGSYCYHIVGFAALKITGCSQGQKEIVAVLQEYISGEGVPSPNAGFGPGSNACAGHTMVVSLWK